MQVYTELTPPTAVSNAVSLAFLGPKAHNLVVAKTSLLQVFELKSIVTEVSQAAKDGPATAVAADDPSEPADLFVQRTEHTSKLVLVAEYPLQGTVLSLARIKALDTKSGGDALLIAFRDAKMSLVEWDPVNHALSTISIHFYEGEELQGAPWDADLGQYHNFLVADPSSRCAALKFGARHLAILPFRQLGDDLVEGDDYDPDLDEPPAAKEKATNGDVPQTPYKSSFALSLPQIDPTLTHPVHLDFLHEYREPTFGIISANKAAAASLLYERRDVLTYTVFTLDLEEKASTALLSVTGLPYDTSKVMPLPLPVGGALLLGANQFIHVDQAGKTNAVAVNDFAKQCSSFPMADQSDLGMRLEGASVELLSSETGDLLVILRDGSLAIIDFKLDGRSVSGISIRRVSEDKGGSVVVTAASCTTSLGRNRMFIGSEDGDSVVLGWTKKATQLSKKRTHAEMLADDAELSFDEEDLEDDDDLYGDGPSTAKASAASTDSSDPGNYTFRIHDSLLSLAPIKDMALASHKVTDTAMGVVEKTIDQLDLVASTGRGKAGALAVMRRELDPVIMRKGEFSTARAVWSVHAKKPAPKGMVAAGPQDAEAKLAADVDYDQFLIVLRSNSEGGEESAVFNITATGFEETSKGDFEREDAATINVGTIAGGTRIVQVLKAEIRSYDSELGLDQILPMEDENGSELRIVSASFADPYILVLRDDSSVIILQADANGEMEEIDRGDALLSTKWLSGCIHQSPTTGDKALAYLLSAEGGLHVYALPDLSKPAYIAASLGFLPPMLTADFTPRRSSAKAALSEILVTDLGDSTSKSPHLIVRTSSNDLVIYQPYHFPIHETVQPFIENLRWLKVPQPRLPEFSEDPALESEEVADGRESILTPLVNVGGYSAAFMAGTSPSFILKESSSLPRVLKMRTKSVKNLSSFHTAECDRGFAFIDTDGNLRVCQLPRGFRYGDVGWAVKKIPMGQDIQAMCYHPPKDVLVLGVGEKEPFTLPEDEHHHEWLEENITFKPMVEHGMIKVLDAQTMNVIDTHELEAFEVVLTIKVLNLEVSENTHERKQLVAVGTGFIRGEDLPSRGCIYVFEVINVVPEPGHPETNRKLKLIAKEEVRGSVTAITDVGSQGFLLMAQGQKCMVRGLKEDGTLLPVAFMDMQCYVTVARELKGSGMLLMGDAAKGAWFVGYTEDPYKMILFGKSKAHMEVMAAEFLPHDKQLCLMVADADCNLHVLQYDPEHPKSLSGQRLLHKSTFHTGHFTTTMTLLPSSLLPTTGTSNPDDPDDLDYNPENNPDAMDLDPTTTAKPPQQHILLTTLSGSVALLTPVSEQQYRRLGALQTFLLGSLEHWCGLNPRAYRAVESEGFGSRGVVDGGLLARWMELGSQRQAEGAAKVGVEEWVLRSDLEFISGAGLGYL
ncbi:Cleavage/polyadenylation specificity factor A subunit [Lasiodiplodia theobromae]|uniref:Protein CFT1 n=1 Tax=Lasiodiplodia theobromae TaxID=45133 RepID=A0A5N5D7Z7_9PEZI|nr:Cleavage/polyadenylation specificity factor A subunit [Lasiodiplodia theobromae]KAB2573936.1 Protein CFT1 [Lasiodiplodia theobromae]KAF4538291.1 Cleavage/polyadenylation specificity factor A subunit [Lasiodiplodia theobromae]KAF9633375.1 Cleavage/polyadenylation specificity factor A subunit [Lasiodiplodia theobromae]